MTFTLRPYQAEGPTRLHERPNWLIWGDCGVGKTIITYEICRTNPTRTVVAAPLSTLETAWMDDARFFPSLRVKLIRASTAVKTRAMIEDRDYDVAIINHAGYRNHHKTFLAVGFDRFVLDESTNARNEAAAFTKACLLTAKTMKSVMYLSGYPTPQDVRDIYWQMRALAPDVLGDSYWRFLDQYSVAKKEKFVVPKAKVPRGLRVVREFMGRNGVPMAEIEKVKKYDQTPAQLASLAALLAPYIWRLTKAGCGLNLPPKTYMDRSVVLDAEEAGIYASVRDQLRLLRRDGSATRLKQEGCLTKLNQITGGGVLADGEHVRTGGSKIRALLEFIEELAPTEPLVVCSYYRNEIVSLVAALSEIGPTEALYGDTSNNAGEIVGRFAEGPTRFLVCNPASCGHGTNGMQRRCSYMAWFGFPNYSSDLYYQMCERIHRLGMGDRPATYIHLITKNTVDEGHIRAVRGKVQRAEAMEEAIRREAEP